MSRKIICFLHDIVESFSSMINVAFGQFQRYSRYICSIFLFSLGHNKTS